MEETVSGSATACLVLRQHGPRSPSTQIESGSTQANSLSEHSRIPLPRNVRWEKERCVTVALTDDSDQMFSRAGQRVDGSRDLCTYEPHIHGSYSAVYKSRSSADPLDSKNINMLVVYMSTFFGNLLSHGLGWILGYRSAFCWGGVGGYLPQNQSSVTHTNRFALEYTIQKTCI